MATVYVSPSIGNDANSYAQAQNPATPWATIGKCETSATTGDTVILMAGTHTWANLTFTKSFIFQGQTSDPTLYIVSAAGVSVQWVFPSPCTTTFQYITFCNNTRTTAQPPFKYGTNTTTTMSFTNCIIRDIVLASGGSGQSGGLISNNSNSGGASHIVNITFTACRIYNISDTGTDNAYRAVFACNHNNAAGTVYNLTITNCVIAPLVTGANELNDIFAFQYVNTGIIVLKNVAIYHPNTNIAFKTDTSGPAYTYSYSGCYNVSSPPAGTGNLTSDPLFVDLTTYNFNLQPSSPYFDAGAN